MLSFLSMYRNVVLSLWPVTVLGISAIILVSPRFSKTRPADWYRLLSLLAGPLAVTVWGACWYGRLSGRATLGWIGVGYWALVVSAAGWILAASVWIWRRVRWWAVLVVSGCALVQLILAAIEAGLSLGKDSL